MKALIKLIRKQLRPIKRLLVAIDSAKEAGRLKDFMIKNKGKNKVFYLGRTENNNLGDNGQYYCIKKWIKENYQAIIIWIFFELVAVGLFIGTNKLFYLLNFSYIGTCISVGCYLYGHNAKYARNLVQFAVGLYMLIYLGLISRENMQIEGFWYYLFLGVFEAAVIHYLVAKIINFWKRMVWICLLDWNDFRFVTI